MKGKASEYLSQFNVRIPRNMMRALKIAAAASKTRRRRIVPLLPVAVEWLRKDAQLAGPVIASLHQRKRMHDIAELAGVRWPHDVLRHTYASMRMATSGADAVSREMGNSENVLLRHYREAVESQDAARFWGLTQKGSNCLAGQYQSGLVFMAVQ